MRTIYVPSSRMLGICLGMFGECHIFPPIFLVSVNEHLLFNVHIVNYILWCNRLYKD